MGMISFLQSGKMVSTTRDKGSSLCIVALLIDGSYDFEKDSNTQLVVDDGGIEEGDSGEGESSERGC